MGSSYPLRKGIIHRSTDNPSSLQENPDAPLTLLPDNLPSNVPVIVGAFLSDPVCGYHKAGHPGPGTDGLSPHTAALHLPTGGTDIRALGRTVMRLRVHRPVHASSWACTCGFVGLRLRLHQEAVQNTHPLIFWHGLHGLTRFLVYVSIKYIRVIRA